MASIDERVVSMSFDNAKFEAGVAQTMATLTKLSASLKNIGSANGLGDIEKAASKINLSGPMSALDKLKEKLNLTGATKGFSDIDAAANKISFNPLSSAIENIKSKLSNFTAGPAAAIDSLKEKLGFKGATAGIDGIETAASRVKFAGPRAAADALVEKLRFPGVEKSFANVEDASSRVKLTSISSAIAAVSNQFSVLQGAAAVAFGSIAAKAASAGAHFASAFSIAPIIGGLKEYSTNLNSIQTILSNTEFQGSTLKDVNAALLQLNKYSDKTIYNFSQMAKNIGTFTAAGVDLDTSVASIKGIANLAALSGSSAEQASTAMYQLSQAIASGRVSLQDWNSVVNAGMGGATFQRALANTASAMGTIADGALKVDKATGKATINGQSFRESITAKPGEESWLTSDVLTNTLQQFTGDLSNAQLKAMGFNAEQIKAIQQTAKTAQNAATQVKTLGQVFDVAKETIGSGWATTFQTIFGNFEEAKGTFTDLSNTINGFINTNSNARNKVLADWKELGGRAVLIDGIKNTFEALGSVVKPLKDAFREIFPAKTGKDLFDLTKKFADFMDELKIGPETANNLKRTFAGFFAVVDIGKQVITGILGVFGDLVGAASDGSGGFLNLTGTIGDFLVSVDEAIKKGHGLTDFFDGLGKVLAVPIHLLGLLAGALASLFTGGGDSKATSSSIDDMTASLTPLTAALKVMKDAWDGFLSVLSSVNTAMGPAIAGIGEAFGNFGDVVANAIQNADYDKVFTAVQTVLIGGIFLAIKKALGGGIKIDLGGGILKNLKGSLSTLTGSLKAMQTQIKAGTLLKIASAVGVLAVGVTALSTIDPKKLASAMTAVAVGLGELVGAMALLTKVGGITSFLTMPFIASSLILLAGAVDVLAIAIKVFSKMDWEGLVKGLVGVGGALTAVALGIKFMPKSIVLIGPALLPLALAMNILAAAVKIFSTIKWEGIAKGLVGIGGALTAIALGLKFMPTISLLAIGPGLIAVGIALNLLAGAVAAFGSMKLATLAKGIAAIAVSLGAIGLAVSLIPPTIALQAAGLVILSVALTGIAGAIAILGGMSIGKIAKGLAAIGASLVVLAAGLTLMGGTLPGAAALLAAAGALAILTPVIGILGSMKFSTIAKGLAAIAATLAVLAIAGLAAAPGITALGIALIPLGAASSLAGAGVYLFALGLSKLSTQGVKSVTTLMLALTAFVALIPKIVINFLKGLVDIAASIAALAPKVVDSMVKIIDALLDVVIKSSPKMAEAATALITAFLNVLVTNTPNFINSGFQMLLSFLSGISNNIGKVIEQVGSIVVNFLTALASALPQIIAAGANLLVRFLDGLASNFPKVIDAGANAIVKFLAGVTRNMPRVVAAALDMVVAFVNSVAENIGKVIDAGANLIVNVLKGIGNNVKKVAKAATDMVGDFLDAAVKAALDLADAGAKAVINFINGVASAIRSHSGELGAAGGNLGEAIIQGAITGMGSMAGAFVDKALSIFGGLPGAVKHLLGIHSPSRVFAEIGENMILGTINGINNNAPQVIQSIESVTNDMIDTMTRSLTVVPDLLDGLLDTEPVITPILDLSNVQANAKKLSDMTNVVPITAAISYNQATSISAAQDVSQTVSDDTTVVPVAPIKFEQNNYSPEALSAIEIYRQTKNQLALAKDAIGVS